MSESEKLNESSDLVNINENSDGNDIGNENKKDNGNGNGNGNGNVDLKHKLDDTVPSSTEPVNKKLKEDDSSNQTQPPSQTQSSNENGGTSTSTSATNTDNITTVTSNTTDTMTPAPKPKNEPDMDNLPLNPMPPHQKKHAVTSIKAVRRLKDAGPFLNPVDIVKLNIPLYYNFIPRPMDLSTIERKLAANAYETPDQVTEDFNLMVQNCFKFNGKDSVISQMVRNIQASFEKHMLNMPPKDLPPQAVSKSRRKPSFNNDIPKLRRESAIDNGRPKREIHPPKPKDMPYDIRPKKKKFQPELRFCQQILKDLMSKKYDSISFPFLQPVDPIALDCPAYFEIIKTPMDASTILNKIQNGEYENATDFEKDVRLIFENCYKFNPEGSAVNMMGHRLEAAFNDKWTNRPRTPISPSGSDEESNDEYEDDEEFKVDINSITDPTIEFLVSNIERMTQDLKKMRQEKFDQLKKDWIKRKKNKKGKKGKNKRKRLNSIGNGTSLNSDSNLDGLYPIHITYDMKKEISEAMTSINDKMLKNVISIIREGVPDLADDDEIELDMDQLNNETLMKLYNYLVKGQNKTNSISKKKKKDVDDEEKKIENLKKKLQQFEQAEKSSDDEDDDEDDDDESSEEE